MILDRVIDSDHNNNLQDDSLFVSRSTSPTLTLSHHGFNNDNTAMMDWGIESQKGSLLTGDLRSFKIRNGKKQASPSSIVTNSSVPTLEDYSSFPTPLTESVSSYGDDNNSKWTFDSHSIYDYDNDLATERSTVVYSPDVTNSDSTFSEDIINFINKYSSTTSSLNKLLRSSTDKFKFEIITSSLLDDTINTSSIRNKPEHDAPQSPRKIVIDISTLPHNVLIHSSTGLLLSIALLKFAQKNINQLESVYIRMMIKIAVTLLNVYNDTRKMASMIYLRMANNKVSSFLKINEKFDLLLNKHLKLIKNSSNSHLNFILGGSLKKQSIRTSKLLTQSTLQTLMLSLNERIQRLIYFVDANYFQRYLDIYHLDFINEDLMFVNMLNHGELLDDLRTPRLKPLRLRTFSGDVSGYSTTSFPQQQLQQPQPQPQQQQSLQQLPNNPFKLLRHFQTIRRVFLCVLLSVMECDSEQPSKESRSYLNICLRKFNLSIPSTNAPILHVGTLTRLYLVIKILSRLSVLFNGLIFELDDESILRDVDYLEEELISPIHEDNEDETFSKLIDCVETLRNKLSYMELNSNSIDSKASLANLDEDMNKLMLLYNQSTGKQHIPSPLLPTSPTFPNSPNSFPSLNLPKRGDRRNRHNRHSSGLRFSLLSVFEDENEQKDESEGSQQRNVTTVVSSNEGIKTINNDEVTEGIRTKEEMKKTLMRLCSGQSASFDHDNLNEKNNVEEEPIHVNDEVTLDQVSRSTPNNSGYVDEQGFETFKLELKQRLMNQLP